MPRINWNQVEREETAIENDATLTPQEKARQLRELHRDLRDEYREEQSREERDEFGW
jgi:hypothetical protein